MEENEYSPEAIDIPEDLPLEKRKLVERMTYGGGFRGDTAADLAINMAYLGKALLDISIPAVAKINRAAQIKAEHNL